MKPRRLLAFLSILLFVAACDDTVSDPPTKNDTPNDPIDSTGFALLAVTGDTLYWGEEAWVQVNELGADTQDLRLFVHTVEVEAMRIEGDRLIFEVPRGAATARLRLYRHDTILAKNDFTLHVLPHHVNEFKTYPLSYYPTEGYPGETIRIDVLDLPMRRREFDVILRGQKLNVLEWDTTYIVVEVPAEKGSGALTLRTFDRSKPIGTFEVLEHDGVFAEQVNLVSVSALTLGRSEAWVGSPDSSMSAPLISFSIAVDLLQSVSVERGDSILIRYVSNDPQNIRNVDVALKPDPVQNRCSGRIVMRSEKVKGTTSDLIQTCEIIVKDIPWKRANGSYVLYANGEDVSSTVVSIEHRIEYPFHKYVERSIEYLGGDSVSYLFVMFSP